MSYRLDITWFLPHVQSRSFKQQFDLSQDRCYPHSFVSFLSIWSIPCNFFLALTQKNFCWSCFSEILKKNTQPWKISHAYIHSLHPFIPWKLFPASDSYCSLLNTWYVFDTYTPHRIYQTPSNFFSEKISGIFLITKTPWLLFSAPALCNSAFSCRFSPHLDQVAHLRFVTTALCILFTAYLTHWKFYGTPAIVLHQQINCFQLFWYFILHWIDISFCTELIFHFAHL